ncbi:MAG: hypothetical protein GPI98_23360, partial [Microcystis aeruginosa W13-13]|nr:hypothetical protein [Microcystis aeruginosa W13-13]
KKTAGTGTTTISTQLNNTGTVQVQTGTLNLTGGGSSSGNWNLSNGATLQLANNYTLQGGVVTGNGTVIGNVANLTQINPGDGVGQLNITGNYNQNSDATLNIELGGNTNYDKLNITGNATLGGTLNISLVNGFAPVLGERYTIFNYGGTLTGGFSNINGLNLGNGLLLQSLIVNKSLVLDVVQDVNYKPGIFSFATTNFSVNENGTPVNTITVNRTAGTDGIVSVTLTPTAGTATAGTDYNSSPITITFNPGEASKTVNIPIIDDNIYEGNETLNLTLSSPTGGATLGTQTTATLTIVDNDLPTVSLAVSPASVTEDGTINLVYTFTRTGNTANPLTVSFNVGGNATFNNDYTQNGAASFNNTSGTITFAAGSDTATLTIDPTADSIFEQDETVSLTLVSSANYNRGTTNTVTSTIINMGSYIVPLNYTATPGQGQTQGGTYNYFDDTNNQLIDGILGVNDWTANLGNGAAYEWVGWINVNPTLNFNFGNSVNISQVQIGFSRAEPAGIYLPDTININGTNFTLVGNEIPNNSRGFINFNGNFTGGGLSISLTDPNTQWIFIDEVKFVTNNNQPGILSFSQPTYSVNENGTAIQQVTVTRTNGSDGEVSVILTPSDGSAIAGDDYTNTPITVTFANGQTSKTVTIPINNDTIYEPTETVNLTISNPTGGATLGTQQTATLTIIDNDAVPGVIQFSNATYSVNENGTPVTAVTLTRSNGSDGTDYNNTQVTVNFANGETSKTVNIPIVNDTQFEPDETVNLSLSNPTGGATLGTQTTAVLTILNDDLPQPGRISLNNINYTVNENGTANITLTRTNGSDGEVSVILTPSNGSATAGDDYTNTPITVTFVNGQTSKTVTIPITDDSIYELTETVNLTISNPTGGATLGTQQTATLSIIDNDAVPGVIQFSNATYSVNENGTPVTAVTLTRSNGSDGAVSVRINLTNGTATAPSDYNNTQVTVNFANGETSKTVNIPIVNDTQFEPDETVN